MMIRKDMNATVRSHWEWALEQRPHLDFSDLTDIEKARIKSLSRHESVVPEATKMWFYEQVYARLGEVEQQEWQK